MDNGNRSSGCFVDSIDLRHRSTKSKALALRDTKMNIIQQYQYEYWTLTLLKASDLILYHIMHPKNYDGSPTTGWQIFILKSSTIWFCLPKWVWMYSRHSKKCLRMRCNVISCHMSNLSKITQLKVWVGPHKELEQPPIREIVLAFFLFL